MFFDYTLEKAKEFIEKYPDYDLYAFATKVEKGKKRLCVIPYDGYTPSYEEIISGKKVRGEFLNFVRNYVFKEFKFYEDFFYTFEGLVWWQVAKKYRVICSTIPLRIYSLSEDSITRPRNKYSLKRLYSNETALTLKLKLFGDDLIKFNPRGKEGYAQTLAVLGWTKVKLGKKREGLKLSLKTLLYNLFEIRAWRNILFSLF